MKKKVVVGVTGGFGTGKTTVCRIFKNLGAVVIDADKIAHDIILPKGPVYKKVVSIFGKTILKKDERVDRKKLGTSVFNDKRRLLLLNSIVHPEVKRRIKEIIRKKDQAIFIIDGPLIVEAGALGMMDKLIVVTLDRKTQIKRCKERFGLKKIDILKRTRSQISLTKKRRLADFIIDNNGSINKTKRIVKEIWREIKDGTRVKTKKR